MPSRRVRRPVVVTPSPLAASLLGALLLASCQSNAPDRIDARAEQAARDAAVAAERGRADMTAHTRPVDIVGYAPPPPPPAPAAMLTRQAMAMPAPMALPSPPATTERYEHHGDNPLHRTRDQPVSTFSIDVDTGSYSNVRRMLRQDQRPPADAVRAEEFLNYFDYQHPAPVNRDTPFRVSTELAPAPWNAERQLLMIGIKGYDVPKATLPPTNLVLLLDTSGSMSTPDKLPLLKQALAQLVPQLRAQDRVSIVVYAGSAGLVLPATPGDRHDEILAALDRLEAGGSTNGGDGIGLAYRQARQAFIADGVNRVVLATDGDFNVGTVDQHALETLVGDQRRHGIALTTLGFGQGNYNDAMAERLADAGDGNHAYIDTLQEARKVLVEQMQSTLLTIARDVKIQVEFNPATVAEYRLVGYENRVLREEDFANDKVDAGDIGAGHQVTALYEITPVGSAATQLPERRYRSASPVGTGDTSELAHLRLRYKRPGQAHSQLIETPILASALKPRASPQLQFAASVVAYADLLRGGAHVGRWDWNEVARTARANLGNDPYRLRQEFVELVEQARTVTQDDQASTKPTASLIEP
jgi:Ca-activated chloride channel family protein